MTLVRQHSPLAAWLRQVCTHPLARDLDLDSPEATSVHCRLIREKAFLRRLYLHYYAQFDDVISRAVPDGPAVEVGAGGGFYRELRPGVRTLDLRPGANVDIAGSAVTMPFRTASVSAVLMLNVLHHLPDPRAFFRECERILKPGGRVCLIEPYAGPLSRRLIRPLHHEPWDETAGWNLPAGGPLTAANMALPSIIFMRDRAQYDSEFPQLPVARIELHTMLLYLMSGGVSMRALVPSGLFKPLLYAEKLLAPAGRYLASMMTVELLRR
jgi:SAM-dependent methyltransferase